jgi:hypothetical protein
MRRTFSRHLLYLIALVLLSPAMANSAAAASVLHDFKSDGCSLFPDGNLEHRDLWCDCCFAHDIAYWRGGTQKERSQVDKTLRDCVIDRTHNKALAVLMYDGVRTGGHPAFPTGYRWAYGWSYGRGYRALSDEEQQQAKEKLEQFFKKYPAGYCGNRADKKTIDERGRP